MGSFKPIHPILTFGMTGRLGRWATSGPNGLFWASYFFSMIHLPNHRCFSLTPVRSTFHRYPNRKRPRILCPKDKTEGLVEAKKGVVGKEIYSISLDLLFRCHQTKISQIAV